MQGKANSIDETKIKEIPERPGESVKDYLSVLAKEKYNTKAYNRLMILYRKRKEFLKEEALIKKAIGIFEAFYAKHQPKHTPAISRISKALAISTGLATKKGLLLFDPEPIATWRKRLSMLQKRLQKK